MTDPPRLLDEGADDFELDVLRSAATDAAPTASLAATLSAVAQAGGAIAPAAGAATGVAAKGAAAKGAAASAGTVAAGAATKALLMKGLLVGVIASGLAVGYAVHSRPSAKVEASAGSESGETTTNEVPPPTSEKATIAAVSAEAPPPNTEAKPEPSSVPSSAPSAQVRSPRAAKRTREAIAEPSVTEQVISLDRVRAAIAARDGGRALRELDRHDREFAGGVLGPEATALRIEAWIVAGDRARATALAEQFLRTPAGGAHATRIRSLLGSPVVNSTSERIEGGASNP